MFFAELERQFEATDEAIKCKLVCDLVLPVRDGE